MSDQQTDEALMLEYRNGDARAFEVLYGRHKGALYRYFLRQCGSSAVAEELFQDVWVNIIRTRKRYEARARFTTYLFHLAHNRLIDHYRRRTKDLPASYDDDLALDALPAGDCDQPEHRVDVKRQVERLVALINELPAAQREAFLLREEGGLSLDEIAEATGVNPETAKSRLRYAVTRLRRDFGELNDG